MKHNIVYSSMLNCKGAIKYFIFWNFSPLTAFYYDPPKIRNFQESPTRCFNYHPLILWNWGLVIKISFYFSCIPSYSIWRNLLTWRYTVNHSDKLMLTYFFRAVFINLYFKTKHSNETFHLGFYSFSNVFSYRKHISSKSNIGVLIITDKSRNSIRYQ